MEDGSFGGDFAGGGGFFEFDLEVAELEAAASWDEDLDASLVVAEVANCVGEPKPVRDSVTTDFDADGGPAFALEAAFVEEDGVSIAATASMVEAKREASVSVGDFKGEGVIAQHVIAKGDGGGAALACACFKCVLDQYPIPAKQQVAGDAFVRLLQGGL